MLVRFNPLGLSLLLIVSFNVQRRWSLHDDELRCILDWFLIYNHDDYVLIFEDSNDLNQNSGIAKRKRGGKSKLELNKSSFKPNLGSKSRNAGGSTKGKRLKEWRSGRACLYACCVVFAYVLRSPVCCIVLRVCCIVLRVCCIVLRVC